MDKKEIVIEKDKLWKYDESKYTEEFCEKLREERRKACQQILEDIEKRKKEAEKIPPEQRPGYAIDKHVAEMEARGDIVDPFIRQHLDAKITVERWKLALGMAATLLFKGQWIIWIVLIILYNLSVTKMKEEALKADKERRKRK